MKTVRTILLGIGLSLIAIGCGGGGGVTVEGKVVKAGGQPFAGGKDGDVNVVLIPASGGTAGVSLSGKAGEDGSFKIEKVPPGKYAVSAVIYPKPPEGGGQPKSPPMPSNKKLDEQWDVSSSNKSFTLDITKLK